MLEPVAVGTPLNEAPLQTTVLMNVGEVAVSYKVDSAGIKRANNSQGHGMPVRCSYDTATSYMSEHQKKLEDQAIGGHSGLIK